LNLIVFSLSRLASVFENLMGDGRSATANRRTSLILLILSFWSSLALAEKQPIRIYTTADGLPSNQINCSLSDSRGFLWFCSREGLSRFDGYTFTTYGVDQGLPDRVVNDFLETRRGEYWVGTTRGVALFNPKPRDGTPLFTAVGEKEIGKVLALLEDAQGTIWVAGDLGVFNLIRSNGAWSLQHSDLPVQKNSQAEGLLEDPERNLWIARYRGGDHAELWRRSPDGKIDILKDPFLTNGNRITSMTEDSYGRLWLSTYRGLVRVVRHPQPGGRIVDHVYEPRHTQTSEAGTVFQASDGRLWVNAGGTQEIVTDAKGRIQIRMVDPTGSGFNMEDAAGNLWSASRKTERAGFVSFGHEDGLRTEDVRSIFEGIDGALYVVTGVHSRYIHRLEGGHFTAVSPKVPGHTAEWDWGGWGWGQTHFQDHLGQWWIATGRGLLRYPKVKFSDLATTTPELIPGVTNVFRLYEDSKGDIWISAWSGSGRWERSSGRFQVLFNIVPTSFREDRAGNLWAGYWEGGLSRYHNGKQEWIIDPKVPTGSLLSIFLDHAGRIWAGSTHGGLLRFDNPTAAQPLYKAYTTKQGLSSDDVRAITEDRFGRIYFWTGKGVDRLDPGTDTIRHYTEADGLCSTGADHNVAFSDRQGRLWFGFEGLSRLDTQPDRPAQPPPIRITRVRIRGADYPVSELGETELSGLVLRHNENQIQIEFASLNFTAGDLIKYQYKLEGAESDWSSPSDLRAVNYPDVPPGRYRFLVRAVNADGMISSAAAVSWRILPPIWLRWWVLTISGAIASYVIFVAYRYRVRQLLELERVRTRIATDLHDDIGSSLTQIAIMSEVVRQQQHNGSAAEPLERIADLSRELVDSMSDIVWAINPKRDHLGDLAQRMRRFVSDVLEGANISVLFHAPAEWATTTLNSDLRREFFLVFKESINNVIRHAECDQVEITFEAVGNGLLLQVRDNGKGFQPPKSDGHGHGLASMQERARRLGGRLEVYSVPGEGTIVRLTAPLIRSTTFRQMVFPRC